MKYSIVMWVERERGYPGRWEVYYPPSHGSHQFASRVAAVKEARKLYGIHRRPIKVLRADGTTVWRWTSMRGV